MVGDLSQEKNLPLKTTTVRSDFWFFTTRNNRRSKTWRDSWTGYGVWGSFSLSFWNVFIFFIRHHKDKNRVVWDSSKDGYISSCTYINRLCCGWSDISSRWSNHRGYYDLQKDKLMKKLGWAIINRKQVNGWDKDWRKWSCI